MRRGGRDGAAPSVGSPAASGCRVPGASRRAPCSLPQPRSWSAERSRRRRGQREGGVRGSARCHGSPAWRAEAGGWRPRSTEVTVGPAWATGDPLKKKDWIGNELSSSERKASVQNWAPGRRLDPGAWDRIEEGGAPRPGHAHPPWPRPQPSSRPPVRPRTQPSFPAP